MTMIQRTKPALTCLATKGPQNLRCLTCPNLPRYAGASWGELGSQDAPCPTLRGGHGHVTSSLGKRIKKKLLDQRQVFQVGAGLRLPAVYLNVAITAKGEKVFKLQCFPAVLQCLDVVDLQPASPPTLAAPPAVPVESPQPHLAPDPSRHRRPSPRLPTQRRRVLAFGPRLIAA